MEKKNFEKKFCEKILKKKFWKSCHGGHFPKIYFSKFGRKIKFFLDGKYLILIRNIDITRESLVKMSVRASVQKLPKFPLWPKKFWVQNWRSRCSMKIKYFFDLLNNITISSKSNGGTFFYSLDTLKFTCVLARTKNFFRKFFQKLPFLEVFRR